MYSPPKFSIKQEVKMLTFHKCTFFKQPFAPLILMSVDVNVKQHIHGLRNMRLSELLFFQKQQTAAEQRAGEDKADLHGAVDNAGQQKSTDAEYDTPVKP